MLCAVNECELFGLWTALRLIAEVRQNPDAIVQSDFLARAQALLTAFVLSLDPFLAERTAAGTLQPRAEQTNKFDA
jgi:hypothetical protein